MHVHIFDPIGCIDHRASQLHILRYNNGAVLKLILGTTVFEMFSSFILEVLRIV